MFRSFVAATSLLGLLAIAFAQAGKNEQAREIKKFQGKWIAESVSIGGNTLTDEQVKKTTLHIKGTKFTMKLGKSVVQGSFKVNAKTEPHEIDVRITSENGQTTELPGIYTWVGKKRKACFALPGYTRPSEFLQQQGYVLLVWKRK